VSDIVKTIPFLLELLNAIPSYVFVFDKDVRVAYCNAAGTEFKGDGSMSTPRKVCGEALHCVHSGEDGLVCGTTRYCKDCILRSSIEKAFAGEKVFRLKTGLTVAKKRGVNRAELLLSTFPFHHDGTPYVLALLDDVSELNELRSMVPICAWCKKIRGDKQYWRKVEDYVQEHMKIQLTHGICPDCMTQFLDDLESQSPRKDAPKQE
jgi:hypothetical protein